ncbi:ribonuclease H-like domain-containing protein [Desarmillaria tabescens]|uniref:3'-5' exonuclease n=1 Tax=Armillaria tabescens TaxID=1929756 RepID=A0AA39NGM8_ARMTA|nr:ribonuclease H-like domain-containing protein [Desarmillaria tabescens]KAK0465286.1 ribonuclease H-like domain-containing protein [Desarmillaria tabescens]
MSDVPLYNWSPGAQPHYITTVAAADAVIARHLEHYVGHVGFDLEWKPSFVRGARENPVALVQIATETEVFLFQLSAMSTVPSSLQRFLEKNSVLKVGVGIQHDVKKLFDDYRFSVLSCVDLSMFARLVSTYLGYTLSKGHITRSNWEAYPLSSAQIRYAANDAHAGYAVYSHLCTLDLERESPVKQSYYSFHAIRGRLYHIPDQVPSSHDDLWGLSATSRLVEWFPRNPEYDPGPPPPPKEPKTPEGHPGSPKDAAAEPPQDSSSSRDKGKRKGTRTRYRPRRSASLLV